MPIEPIRIPLPRNGPTNDKHCLVFVEMLVRDPSIDVVEWHEVDMLFDTGASRTLLPNPKHPTGKNGKHALPREWLLSKAMTAVQTCVSSFNSPLKRVRFSFRQCTNEFDALAGFMPGTDDVSTVLATKKTEESIKRSFEEGKQFRPLSYGVLSLYDLLKHFDILIDRSGDDEPFCATLNYRGGGLKRTD